MAYHWYLSCDQQTWFGVSLLIMNGSDVMVVGVERYDSVVVGCYATSCKETTVAPKYNLLAWHPNFSSSHPISRLATQLSRLDIPKRGGDERRNRGWLDEE